MFVARRLLAEKIALLFAAREVGDTLAGLPEVRLEGLGARDARALLESALPARLDDPILERLIVEARGNPLALLEMPRGLTAAQLAGGFGLPTALPLVDPDRGELRAATGESAARCPAVAASSRC